LHAFRQKRKSRGKLVLERFFFWLVNCDSLPCAAEVAAEAAEEAKKAKETFHVN
jgi:hypothetical protein